MNSYAAPLELIRSPYFTINMTPLRGLKDFRKILPWNNQTGIRNIEIIYY